MDEKALQQKIAELENELKTYRYKEDYINEGVIKTKEVYEVARHNAEKIISRAIIIAYDVKEKVVNFLTEFQDDLSVENFKGLLDKYHDIFQVNRNDIKEISQKLVDKVKK